MSFIEYLIDNSEQLFGSHIFLLLPKPLLNVSTTSNNNELTFGTTEEIKNCVESDETTNLTSSMSTTSTTASISAFKSKASSSDCLEASVNDNTDDKSSSENIVLSLK